MAFIRTKNIKGNEYYYLVESYRKNGRMHQRTIKYLGKKKPTEKEIQRIIEKKNQEKKQESND